MVIAISRPKNLKDVLIKAALRLPENLQMKKLIEEAKLQTS
jgi:hypothetical protein